MQIVHNRSPETTNYESVLVFFLKKPFFPKEKGRGWGGGFPLPVNSSEFLVEIHVIFIILKLS